ncbi:MAG: CHAD domain-containing protein [Solirubrobacteraceae bacterium]
MSASPPKAKIRIAMAPEQRSDAAAAAVLRGLLEVILANREGALVGRDPEHLHQLRISVRRSRTVQRQLAGVFPPLELRGFRSEFRWLQRATGEARDLDVHVADFASLRALLPESVQPDLGPLRLVLEHWRLAAHGQLISVLRSRRTEDLLGDWEMLLESLVELPTADRGRATRPIGELSAHRVRRVYKRLLKMAEAISDTSSASAVHELRKKGKELRYLLDLFAVPLHSADSLAPLIRPLKELQEVLGRHQDREVQIAMLRGVAGEVAGLTRGPQAVLAMGMLIDRLENDARAARSELAGPMAELGAGEQRRLVRDTFAHH